MSSPSIPPRTMLDAHGVSLLEVLLSLGMGLLILSGLVTLLLAWQRAEREGRTWTQQQGALTVALGLWELEVRRAGHGLTTGGLAGEASMIWIRSRPPEGNTLRMVGFACRARNGEWVLSRRSGRGPWLPLVEGLTRCRLSYVDDRGEPLATSLGARQVVLELEAPIPGRTTPLRRRGQAPLPPGLLGEAP